MNQQAPIPHQYLQVDSSSVQTHLQTLRSLISRMAANSSHCKTWCIALVSLILVVVADKKIPNSAWIAFIPVFLCFFLDTYYVAQERAFRDLYNYFINKLYKGIATTKDLFILEPLQGFDLLRSLSAASASLAIGPFYLTLAGTIFVARQLIL